MSNPAQKVENRLTTIMLLSTGKSALYWMTHLDYLAMLILEAKLMDKEEGFVKFFRIRCFLEEN